VVPSCNCNDYCSDRTDVLNRSINRDFDIRYETRLILYCLEDIQKSVSTLRAVGYEPTELLERMGELWATLTCESKHIL
jgi:hypothetical protein